MKRCSSCGEEKQNNEFYSSPDEKGGIKGICKKCCNFRTKLWQKNNSERQAFLAKRWRNKNKERVRFLSKRWRKENVEKATLHTQTTRAKNPDKYRARTLVTNMISQGKLQKQPCIECGSTLSTEAHHTDYSKPLDITWLCRKCHMEAHKEPRKAL